MKTLNKCKYLLLVSMFLVLGSVNVMAIETVDTDSTQIYRVVDKMPEIKGGIEAVYQAIVYPKEALDKRIEGRVFLKFIIDEKGNVTNAEVLKDIGAGCGQAAIRGIEKVGFTPGLLDGKAVKVHFSLPITFKMAD